MIIIEGILITYQMLSCNLCSSISFSPHHPEVSVIPSLIGKISKQRHGELNTWPRSHKWPATEPKSPYTLSHRASRGPLLHQGEQGPGRRGPTTHPTRTPVYFQLLAFSKSLH